MSEVFAIDPLSSIHALWRRRWILAGTVLVAFMLGYVAALALPKTWESQSVVQIGQVGTTAIDDPAGIVRAVNVGALKCSGSGDGSARLDGVNAGIDGGPEFRQIRIVARASTADDARARAAAATACVVGMDRELFESASRRDSQFLESLEFTMAQQKDSIAAVTRALDRATGSPSNAAEMTLLVMRVGEERSQLLELAARVQKIHMDHARDVPTSVLIEPSQPASPVWPRPRLFAIASSAVALFLSSLFVLLASARPSPRQS